jgi:serine protease AprX
VKGALMLAVLSCLVLQAGASGALAPERGVSPPGARDGPSFVWPPWSRDSDGNRLDDELDFWISEPSRESFPVVVCYDRMPGAAGARSLEALGAAVDFTSRWLPCLAASLPRDSVGAALLLPGVVRIEAAVPLKAALDTSLPSIGVDRAWQRTGLRGSGVTICVIDSGIDANHTSLDDLDDLNTTKDPKVVAFYDAADSPEATDGSTRPFDPDGHGTHVAAIAAGTGQGTPDLRYTGVAPGARLVGVKILQNGSTSMSMDDALRGIEWAISNKDRYGIRVLSMSFGAQFLAPGITNDGSSAMSQLCDRAVAAGLVCVAAAGNNGPLKRSITPPGDAIDVITVGNVRDDHSLNPSSSRGPVGRLTGSYIKPDVCGPGTDVYSAEANSGDKFTTKTGTSMACPHIAGLAALMLQASSGLRPQDIKDLLHTTAEPAKSFPWQSSPNNDYGWGVVDALAAVENCTSGTLPPVVYINPLERANGTVLVKGTAASARGTVEAVEVRIDSGPFAPASGTANWSYSWNTTGHPNGPHTVTARAFDGELYSYEYRLVVTVDNLYIQISPPNSPEVSGEWTVSGTADGLEVRLVEVRIDGQGWEPASDLSGSGWRSWQYTVNTTKLPNGRHRLEARAYDGSRYSPLADLEFQVKNKVPASPGPAGMIGGFGALAAGAAAALALAGARRRRRSRPAPPH